MEFVFRILATTAYGVKKDSVSEVHLYGFCTLKGGMPQFMKQFHVHQSCCGELRFQHCFCSGTCTGALRAP